MDRKEVEALLACTQDSGQWILDTPQMRETLAALCRTQLAVWDAPVATAQAMVGDDEIIGMDLAYLGADAEKLHRLDGQRVRIVPEGE